MLFQHVSLPFLRNLNVILNYRLCYSTTCCRAPHWFSLGFPKPDGDGHSASKKHGMIGLSHSHSWWKFDGDGFQEEEDDEEDDEDQDDTAFEEEEEEEEEEKEEEKEEAFRRLPSVFFDEWWWHHPNAKMYETRPLFGPGPPSLHLTT